MGQLSSCVYRRSLQSRLRLAEDYVFNVSLFGVCALYTSTFAFPGTTSVIIANGSGCTACLYYRRVCSGKRHRSLLWWQRLVGILRRPPRNPGSIAAAAVFGDLVKKNGHRGVRVDHKVHQLPQMPKCVGRVISYLFLTLIYFLL